MPKLTVLEKTIQAIDDQIAALQLARKHLVEQQKSKVSRPRVVPKEQSAS